MTLARSVRPAARPLSGFRQCQKGATAVEFGFVALIFITFISTWMELGLVIFMQSTLDRAVRKESRLIKVGTITASGASTFAANLCSDLSALMTCSLIQVNVTSGSTFSSLSSTVTTTSANRLATTGFNPGGSGDNVMVQVGYTMPLIIPLVSSLIGKNNSYFFYSSLAFQNEPF